MKVHVPRVIKNKSAASTPLFIVAHTVTLRSRTIRYLTIVSTIMECYERGYFNVRSSVKQYDVQNNGHKLIANTLYYQQNPKPSLINLNSLKSKRSQDCSTFVQEM